MRRDDALPFICTLLATLLAVGFVAALARAQVHDHGTLPLWLVSHPDFPWCCSARDCELIETRDMRPTAEGWVVTLKGRVYPPVPYAQAKLGRDGQHAVCILPGQDTVRCLFISPSGS